MKRFDKFLLVFIVGSVTFCIALEASVERIPFNPPITHLGELFWTFGLFTIIASILSVVADRHRRAAGWWTFCIGLIGFCIIGGMITDFALVYWLCGISSVVYALMVGLIPRKR